MAPNPMETRSVLSADCVATLKITISAAAAAATAASGPAAVAVYVICQPPLASDVAARREAKRHRALLALACERTGVTDVAW